MGDFTISIKGLAELQKSADRMTKEMRSGLRDTMRSSLIMLQTDARDKSTFKNQTGNLRRRIQYDVESEFRGVVRVDPTYAPFIEFGTRPHTIYPKGKFLVFKVGGKKVFARRVNHPGTRPYKFMENAFNRNKLNIQRNYEMLISRILKAL